MTNSRTVSLVAEQQGQISVYTVLDINDSVIITTTSYKLAQSYFKKAQQWGTVRRVCAVDQFLDRYRSRPRC